MRSSTAARSIVASLSIAAFIGGCGGGSSDGSTNPTTSVSAPVLTTINVALTSSSIVVGQTTGATAAGADQNGAPIATGTVTWSSTGPSIATVSSSGAVTALAVGQVEIVASAGGKTGQATLTVTSVPVATVNVTPVSASLVIGGTQQLSATTLDVGGNLLTGRVVTWSTSDSTKATVSSSGLVTAIAAGTATITATSEGKTGTAAITVTPPPVATVTVAPTSASIVVGATQQLTATARDVNGNTVSGATVTWSSSALTVASVSATGLVTAVAAGAATITATSQGKTGTATITVNAPPVASISVAPTSASITVGATQQLTATALDANGNVISGATVTWSSSAPAIASVSTTGLVTAIAAGAATITATSGSKTGTASITVTAVSASITLSAAGQSVSFLTSSTFNQTLALQPGAQYLISVVNTDPSYTQTEDFTLSTNFTSTSSARGLPGSVRTSAMPVPRASADARPALGVAGQRLPSLAMLRGLEENHMGVLANNLQTFARFGNPSVAWAKARALTGRQAPVSAAVSQTIGAVSKVYVLSSLSGGCTNVDSIGARTVAVGQHVIVLADTNRTTWPQAFRPDSSFYQTFANEYDAITWPHLLTYIGNPLAYDASLSSTGKVTVTITPVLNTFGGAAGGGSVVAFVNGCDFFPFASSGVNADFSNRTEMFYSWVPSASGYDVATWENALRATAAHESKHIVSYSDRIINDSPVYEVIWLEEGLAQVSSEIWERNFNTATWLGQATFAQTAACEISGEPCDPENTKPLALLASHLPFLFDYLQTESTSNGEGLGLDTPSNYGAGWTFGRWAIDQYAGSGGEGTFIKSLINEPQLNGLPNLSAHTGQSVPLLLVYWNVATGIFQTPTYTAADVRTTVPSFNFTNIFDVGQTTAFSCGGTPCGVFTTSGKPIFPIQPITISSGAFAKTVTSVPGTSASFFLLTGSAAGIESIQLLSGSGAAISSSSGFRVAILRVQ